jgi:hypothetical protein
MCAKQCRRRRTRLKSWLPTDPIGTGFEHLARLVEARAVQPGPTGEWPGPAGPARSYPVRSGRAGRCRPGVCRGPCKKQGRVFMCVCVCARARACMHVCVCVRACCWSWSTVNVSHCVKSCISAHALSHTHSVSLLTHALTRSLACSPSLTWTHAQTEVDRNLASARMPNEGTQALYGYMAAYLPHTLPYLNHFSPSPLSYQRGSIYYNDNYSHIVINRNKLRAR